jgi:hypothetical protein
VSRGPISGWGSSSGGAKEFAMERTHAATGGDRHDVILRLRQQVAEGAYEPPVDELVNRLVSVVMARRAAGTPGAAR